MFLGTSSIKGHSNSSSALKRHGLRVRNKCSKSLCIIVAISVVILIAISTTVVHLGQDLIYADRAEKESVSHEHPLPPHSSQAGIPPLTQEDTSSSDSTSESSDDDSTERMDINGKEVDMKKSELERVWNEVQSELPQSDDGKIENVDEDHHSDEDHESDDDSNENDDGSNESDDESKESDDNNMNDDGMEEKHEDDGALDDDNESDNEDNENESNDHNDSDHHNDNAQDENENESDNKEDADIDSDNNDEEEKASDEEEIDMESEDEEDKDRENLSYDHDDDAAADQLDSGDNESSGAIKNELQMVFDDEDMLEESEKKEAKSEDEEESSDSQTSSSSLKKGNAPSLDSDDLERLLYPEYFELPTFFDIDPEDVDALVRYWKQPGTPHYEDLQTKYREIHDYDLKDTIMYQDEYHNKKLNYLYDVDSDPGHSWNVDYDYLYPFMIPVDAYDPSLLNAEVFAGIAGNMSHFIHDLKQHPSPFISAKWDIYDMFAVHNYRYQRVISKQRMYAKHEAYLRDHYDEVELIFPENDTLLFAMLNRFGERLKAHIADEEEQKNDSTESHNHGGRFLRALKRIEDKEDSSSKKGKGKKRRRRRLEGGFGLFDSKEAVDLAAIDIENDVGDSTKEDVEHPRIHTFNGFTADITYLHRNRSTVQYYHNMELDDPQHMFMSGNLNFNDAMEGDLAPQVMYKNHRFWRLHEHCVRRKSTTVYPNWRILYASKPLTCDIILQQLLDPISTCLMEEGLECPLMIDHGYFRFVFKSEAPAKYLYENPSDPEEMIPIVLKVMKTQFVDWTTDWMRHIREAIFLQQLQRWEKEVIDRFGAQFQSLGQDRAFYFVPELGHCLYPTYITVTPYYEKTLKQFTRNGGTKNMSLRDVTVKALQILNGLQVMHNIEGGPYMHTDLQPRQFMMDDDDNVLINDFNRGKFTEYYFKNEVERTKKGDEAVQVGEVIIPCTYCMPYSHGHYRAPEEYYSDPLNEGLDLWSICYTIWNLFSYEKPWKSMGKNYEAIKYILHDYQMRSKLPYSMPPYVKDVIRHCWRQNMYDRPDINELMRSFRYFYKHIDTLSDGRQHSTLDKLSHIKAYRETNFPDMEKIKEYT